MHTAIEVVIVGNYFIIACNFLGVALIFNVFAHLPSEEKWNRLFSFLEMCLCMSKSRERAREKEGSLSHIAICFGEVFQGADLVPSDIAAGLVLLALQHRRILESETLGRSAEEGENSGAKGHVDESKSMCTAPASFDTVNDAHIFASMKISLIFIDDADIGKHTSVELGNLLEEGAHYARWALASYGWMLYTWANPRGGLAMAFSGEGPCTCCTWHTQRIFRGEHRPTENLDKAALMTCAGIRAEDLYYVSFTNG